MNAQLIAAASAVVVALIAAVVSVSTSSDHRKQALDEAELLAKLKASMGADAPAVLDLQDILSTRVSGWRRWRVFHRVRMLLQLSFVVGAVSWTAFVTRRMIPENTSTSMVSALGILGDTALVVFLVLILVAVVTVFFKIPKYKALSRPYSEDERALMKSSRSNRDE